MEIGKSGESFDHFIFQFHLSLAALGRGPTSHSKRSESSVEGEPALCFEKNVTVILRCYTKKIHLSTVNGKLLKSISKNIMTLDQMPAGRKTYKEQIY